MNPDYRGLNGYIKYANDHRLGKMKIAYQNMSSILTESNKNDLRWGKSYAGTTLENQQMRQLLSKSQSEELDYEKWFGKYEGLDAAVNEYMMKLGYQKPFNKMTLNKIRQMFRGVVTESELKSLGWDSVKVTRVAKAMSLSSTSSKKTTCESIFFEPKELRTSNVTRSANLLKIIKSLMVNLMADFSFGNDSMN